MNNASLILSLASGVSTAVLAFLLWRTMSKLGKSEKAFKSAWDAMLGVAKIASRQQSALAQKEMKIDALESFIADNHPHIMFDRVFAKPEGDGGKGTPIVPN